MRNVNKRPTKQHTFAIMKYFQKTSGWNRWKSIYPAKYETLATETENSFKT